MKKFKVLGKSHRDKLWRLQIDSLNLTMIDNEISIETVEVLNEIKLNTISIDSLNNSFENAKMCLNLNSITTEVLFKDSWKTVWRLELFKTPVLLFDSESNQKLHFLCESAVFEVNEDGFKEIVLLKANETYQK